MNLPSKIGRYEVRRLIGEGGMGQVFLAYDPITEREIALKRVRPEMMQYHAIKHRFLKEAKISAQLTHPSILSVYAIEESDEEIYYIMPYIEGKTLKATLNELRKTKKPSLYLLRPFLMVLQAIKYAHSKGILHRDIKPENILLGPFSEVLVYDFGLAEYRDAEEENITPFPIVKHHPNLTRVGKIVGTITYMAPERVIEKIDSPQSDIYSLGVILYQILTLRHPFRRKSVKAFKQQAKEEVLVDPTEMAPKREIPPTLSRVVKKCLEFSKEKRYATIDELIVDIEQYLEGRADWIFTERLSIQTTSNWELQETVIMRQNRDWAVLMISSASFPGHLKLEMNLLLEEKTEGVGLLLAIPGQEERHGLEEGYCLWFSLEGVRLLRSGIEVKLSLEKHLAANVFHEVVIEKLSDTIEVRINKELFLTYRGFQPLVGAHLGLLYKDLSFNLQDFFVFIGSYNAKVGCLTIPDTFLAVKYFDKALAEYEKISRSFHGRIEGLEALFRSGLTLIEMGQYDRARDYFAKLHKTRLGLREWLGKALTYRKEEDFEEEAKCLEIAICLFREDSEFSLIEEEILFRMEESQKENRKAPYYFAFLLTRYRLATSMNHRIKELLSRLEMPKGLESYDDEIQLAFLLNKKNVLKEKKALFPLALLGGKEEIDLLQDSTEYKEYLAWLKAIQKIDTKPLIEEPFPKLSLLFGYINKNALPSSWEKGAFTYEKRLASLIDSNSL